MGEGIGAGGLSEAMCWVRRSAVAWRSWDWDVKGWARKFLRSFGRGGVGFFGAESGAERVPDGIVVLGCGAWSSHL